MNSRQKRAMFILMAGVLFVWILSPLAGFRPPPITPSTAPLLFDATRAYSTIEDFVTLCPNRIFGSFESRRAPGYLREGLESLGYESNYTQFSARIDGSKQVGRNVFGYKAGKNPEIIALVAHYDTARTTVQGAMDNGSGVGVLMEIARILAQNPTNRSILIIFTDGGEWGMLGAKDVSTRHSERARIVAVLSLDYASIGDPAALHLEETGLLRGYTPPWYRILARSAAEEAGLPVLSSYGLREHLARTLLIPGSDQGPFLSAGIPAINLGSHSADRIREWAVYHSPLDTIEKLEIPAIESLGIAAERIVRTLDELPAIPRESMDSFRLRHTLFLGPTTIRILHGILFLPLVLCLFFHIRNHYRSLEFMKIGREILAFLVTLFPLLMIYAIISLFRFLRILPVYDLYPAGAKDPALQNPSWGILGGIFGTALIIAALCTLTYIFAFRKRPKPNYYTSKAVLLCLTLIAVIAALLYNSYWAVTFVLLPCWIWSLVGRGTSLNRRLSKWIWILTAALPCCVVFWLMASRFGVGAEIFWYQVLALNTGLFSARGFFLGAVTAALGIRFLVAQLHEADGPLKMESPACRQH